MPSPAPPAPPPPIEIATHPRHGRLRPRAAPAHLLVADAEGGAAVLALAIEVGRDWFDAAEILYAPGTGEADHRAALAALGCPRLRVAPSVDALVARLSGALERAPMGTALYVAGSERLLGLATRTAMAAGIDHRSLVTEHRGSLARRVRCVHCKGLTEEVESRRIDCAHCGLRLFVRDHYSRRLAAYQGIAVETASAAEASADEGPFR